MKKLNKIVLGLLLANVAFLSSNAMKRSAGEITGSGKLDQRIVRARLINPASEDNRTIVPIDDIRDLTRFIQNRSMHGTQVYTGTSDIQNLNIIEAIRLRRFVDEGPFDEISVNTALTEAAEYGFTDILRKLLNNDNANLFIRDCVQNPEDDNLYGLSFAFMMAAKNGHHECIQILIDDARSLNLINDVLVNTALTDAAENGHANVIRALFSNERIIGLIRNYLVDPDALDEDDFADTNYGINAAFRFAAINGHSEALAEIISTPRIFRLIDMFTVNDVLPEIVKIDIIRILLGNNNIKRLIHLDGINEALRIAQRDGRYGIHEILNVYKDENF